MNTQKRLKRTMGVRLFIWVEIGFLIMMEACSTGKLSQSRPCIISKNDYSKISRETKKGLFVKQTIVNVSALKINNVVFEKYLENLSKEAEHYFNSIGVNCFYGSVIIPVDSIGDSVIVSYNNGYYSMDTSQASNSVSSIVGGFESAGVGMIVLDIDPTSNKRTLKGLFSFKNSEKSEVASYKLLYGSSNAYSLANVYDVSWFFRLQELEKKNIRPIYDSIIFGKYITE